MSEHTSFKLAAASEMLKSAAQAHSKSEDRALPHTVREAWRDIAIEIEQRVLCLMDWRYVT